MVHSILQVVVLDVLPSAKDENTLCQMRLCVLMRIRENTNSCFGNCDDECSVDTHGQEFQKKSDKKTAKTAGGRS